MYDSAAGAIDDTIRSWVHDLINGLYGYLHLIFGPVIAAWDKLVHAGWLVWHAVSSFIDEVTITLARILLKVIPDLIKWAKDAIALVQRYAVDVYNFAVRELNALRAFVLKLIADLTTWVISHIYDPLKAAFDLAWHWITHEGAIVWHYISNPADLVDLLWDYLIAKLEREAWNIASKLGRFFLALVAHNLTRLVTLIEDVLSAIL